MVRPDRSGQTIRWVLHHDLHTTTAYHPTNDGHSLRIPEGAEPWNSGFLLKAGAHFEVTLTVEGAYDNFCLPHEQAGWSVASSSAVLRVPAPCPSTISMAYAAPRDGRPCRMPRSAFPAVDRIMQARIVRRSKSPAPRGG